MSQLYYTPPNDLAFEQVKEAAMQLWAERYPEETSPNYAKEKIDRIKDIENVGDNFMYIVGMFDEENQMLLSQKIPPATRKLIRDRLIDGGADEHTIIF